MNNLNNPRRCHKPTKTTTQIYNFNDPLKLIVQEKGCTHSKALKNSNNSFSQIFLAKKTFPSTQGRLPFWQKESAKQYLSHSFSATHTLSETGHERLQEFRRCCVTLCCIFCPSIDTNTFRESKSIIHQKKYAKFRGKYHFLKSVLICHHHERFFL